MFCNAHHQDPWNQTEFLLLGTKQQLAKVDINSITVGGSVVNTKPVVRNLGSWFDSQLSMSTHISKLCSSAFFHLHNISRIRKFLSPVETKSLVHAFVTSRVDYCSSLLYGLPASQLNKVQRVLHTAARLVCCAPRFSQGHPMYLFLVLQANFCWLGDLDKIICPWKLENCGCLR